MHHALFAVLDPIVRRGLIADTYACLPGRGAHRTFQRFLGFCAARQGRGWIVKTDEVADRRLLALLVLMARVAWRAPRPAHVC